MEKLFFKIDKTQKEVAQKKGYLSKLIKFSSESSGFTLIELLVVLVVILILVSITIYTYYLMYLPKTIKASLISDIKNCATNIVISGIDNNRSLSEVVSNCSKSKYTREIVLESTNPVVMKAISQIGNITCLYNDTGSLSFITCNE